MANPVFFSELLLASRRWQTFALRTGFLLALLVSLMVVQATFGVSHGPVGSMDHIGAAFFYALVGTMLALVLLAGPAYTAGAICREKEEGHLDLLLTTQLSSWHIVPGLDR